MSKERINEINEGDGDNFMKKERQKIIEKIITNRMKAIFTIWRKARRNMENFDKERREIVMNGELFIKLAKVEETI